SPYTTRFRSAVLGRLRWGRTYRRRHRLRLRLWLWLRLRPCLRLGHGLRPRLRLHRPRRGRLGLPRGRDLGLPPLADKDVLADASFGLRFRGRLRRRLGLRVRRGLWPARFRLRLGLGTGLGHRLRGRTPPASRRLLRLG